MRRYLRSSEQLLLGIKPTILWSYNGSLRICWWGKWIFQAWNRDRIGLNPQHVPSNQLDKRHVCCIFDILWWDTTDIINMIWYGEIPYITDIINNMFQTLLIWSMIWEKKHNIYNIYIIYNYIIIYIYMLYITDIINNMFQTYNWITDINLEKTYASCRLSDLSFTAADFFLSGAYHWVMTCMPEKIWYPKLNGSEWIMTM